MQIVLKPSSSGKTTDLIKLCAESTQGYIVCPLRKDCDRVFAQAKEMGLKIPFPLSWDEFIKGQYYPSGIGQVFIDDLDRCIALSSMVKIAAVSMNEDSENDKGF